MDSEYNIDVYPLAIIIKRLHQNPGDLELDQLPDGVAQVAERAGEEGCTGHEQQLLQDGDLTLVRGVDFLLGVA
jgi:hypothetical protein